VSAHVFRSVKLAAEEPVKILNRKRRGDHDVKIAEYFAWMREKGARIPPGCVDVGCGLVDIIEM